MEGGTKVKKVISDFGKGECEREYQTHQELLLQE